MGYHPILATRADTREVLHIRLRKVSANTQKGMLRFTEELIARVARAGASGIKLFRADSGFWNVKVFERLEKASWQYSVGVRMQKGIRKAVEAIDEDAWTKIEDYPEEGEAQIANLEWTRHDSTEPGADQRVRKTGARSKCPRKRVHSSVGIILCLAISSNDRWRRQSVKPAEQPDGEHDARHAKQNPDDMREAQRHIRGLRERL